MAWDYKYNDLNGIVKLYRLRDAFNEEYMEVEGSTFPLFRRTVVAMRAVIEDLEFYDLLNFTINSNRPDDYEGEFTRGGWILIRLLREELDGRLRDLLRAGGASRKWVKTYKPGERSFSAFYDDDNNTYPNALVDLYPVFDRSGDGVMAEVTVLPDGGLRISLEDYERYLASIGASPDSWLDAAYKYTLGGDIFTATEGNADLVLVARGDEHLYTK